MLHGLILSLIGATLGGTPSKPAERPVGTHSFTTLGLYIDFDSVPSLLPFLKSCGYNALEFCDASTLLDPSIWDNYHQRMADGIEKAQKDGFQVRVILLSNVGPRENKQQTDQELHFPPGDTRRMEKRLTRIAKEVRRLRAADGFVFFAGDPGGDPSKQSDLSDCLAMGRRVKAIIEQEAPHADFIFNSWAIASWKGWPSPATVAFWDIETELTRRVLQEPNWIGPRIGMEFPLHNYYRSLALKCYADARREPQPFPTGGDIESLRRQGTRHMWGWPYFLIDECDDGFTGKTWNQPQAETRYLHQIVTQARALGLNGLVGNLSGRGTQSEILNVYAFSRFSRDRSATPAGTIREFAGFIAEETSSADLARVLSFIENHSSWQAAMPAGKRLPDLDCGGLDCPDRALACLQLVAARQESGIPLPIAPAAYIERLTGRLRSLSSKPAP